MTQATTLCMLVALAVLLTPAHAGSIVYQVRDDASDDQGSLSFFRADELGNNATHLITLNPVLSGRASFDVVGDMLFFTNFTNGIPMVQNVHCSSGEPARVLWSSNDSNSDIAGIKAYQSKVYFTVSSDQTLTLYSIDLENSFRVEKVLDFGDAINGFLGALDVNFGSVIVGGCDEDGVNGGACKPGSGALSGTTLPTAGVPGAMWLNKVRTPVYAVTMADVNTTYFAGKVGSNSITIVRSAKEGNKVVATITPAWSYNFPMANNFRGTLFAVQDSHSLVSIDTTVSPPTVNKIIEVKGLVQGVVYVDQ